MSSIAVECFFANVAEVGDDIKNALETAVAAGTSVVTAMQSHISVFAMLAIIDHARPELQQRQWWQINAKTIVSSRRRRHQPAEDLALPTEIARGGSGDAQIDRQTF